LNKYLHILPFGIFAICVVVAILLTLIAPSLWPAGLAIAIAGSALALAFRSQDTREIGYLTDDITVLQEQNAALKEQTNDLKAEVTKNQEMIDELADIVEQIATLTADGGDITKAQVEALRDEMAEVRSARPMAEPTEHVAMGQLNDLESRLAALEARSTDAQTDEIADASLGLGTAAAATAGTAAAAASVTKVSNLRSMMAQGSGQGEITESTQVSEAPFAATTDAALAPVFQPELGAPVAFILQLTETEDFSVLLQHAIQVSTELEEAQRENLLFVKLPAETLADSTVRDSILAAVAAHPALQRRLAILTAQQGFGEAALKTLSAIAAEGCRFGLYAVRDWSINLASLARDGMAFILVDGPAMARSAQDQGGDPRRLAQALRMHDIALIGGDVASEEDLYAVSGLEPTFVTGDGLGETRVLGIAS